MAIKMHFNVVDSESIVNEDDARLIVTQTIGPSRVTSLQKEKAASLEAQIDEIKCYSSPAEERKSI